MYEEFYHLNANPFQLSPTSSLFFNSSGHKRGFAYLQYGVEQGEGFIVISGDVGTGKTTLVERLFASLKYAPVVAARIVTSQLEGDDLLYMVAASLDIDTQGLRKPQVLAKIEQFLKHQHERKKRVLMVIDEAQNLSLTALEELRMLSNFTFGGKSALQCFLLGQNELRPLLAHKSMEQLRQRIIASSHLEPLTEAETKDYILYRLIKAGWRDDPQYEERVFARIFQFSGGIPRKINRVCDRMLLTAFLEERHQVDEALINNVINEMEQEMSIFTREPPGVAPRDAEEIRPLVGAHEGSSVQMDSAFAKHLNYRLDQIELQLGELDYKLSALCHPDESQSDVEPPVKLHTHNKS